MRNNFPVDAVMPRLCRALAEHGRAVLTAAPGSGKTTRVPPALLGLLPGQEKQAEKEYAPAPPPGKILVLEPRRLAARASARYMAGLLGESVGCRVGYRVRLESKVSEQTVIEILTEQVSDAYLAFLQIKKISYIFAGTDMIDFAAAVKKLKALFGIEKLKLSGGGVLNWSFAQAGLIDELSLIIAPVADGAADTPTLFERSEKLSPHAPVGFNLKSVEAAKDGCVWLRYTAK